MKNLSLKEKISKNFLFDGDIAIFHEIDKQRILRNNLKLIFFLSLFPFFGTLFSLIYYRWYKLELSNNSSLWFHLIFVYDEANGSQYFFGEFIGEICRKYVELIEKNGCSFYNIFQISGVISFICICCSIIFYFLFLLQLLLTIKNRGKFLSKFCFKQKTKQIFSVMMNILGLFFWLIVCILTEFSIEKIGISVYVLFISSMFMMPLICYYMYMKKRLMTENAISNLLNPEQVWKEDFETNQY